MKRRESLFNAEALGNRCGMTAAEVERAVRDAGFPLPRERESEPRWNFADVRAWFEARHVWTNVD
jgi:hypothetical protein